MIQAYVANTWYDIKITIVSATQFDVSVNGTSYNNGGAHFNAQGTVSSIARFILIVGTSGSGAVASMDNIVASWLTFMSASTTFTLSSTDGSGSGIASIHYHVLGTATYTTYAGPFTLASLANGTYTMHCWSIDNAGLNQTSPTSIVVYLDRNAGTSTLSYAASYTTGGGKKFVQSTTSFSLSASDGAGESGIASILYMIDSSGWNTYTGAFTLAGRGNGTHFISFESIDNVGNVETTQVSTVYLDSNAPTAVISYTPAYTNGASKPYISTSTTITLSAFDAGTGETGVAAIYYTVKGYFYVLGAILYSSPITAMGLSNGTYTLLVWAIDLNGNNQTVATSAVMNLDADAGTTTLSYTPVVGPNAIGPFTPLTLTATDAGSKESGIAMIYWEVDAGGYFPYYPAHPLLVNASFGNGYHDIHYYSVDNVGNTETIETTDIYLDAIAPTSSISYTPAYTHAGKSWVRGNTTFSITATDDAGGTGVDYILVMIDASGWSNYVAPFTLALYSNGTHQVVYAAVDQAGNLETTNVEVVNLDILPPTTAVSYSTAFIPPFTTVATFTMSAIDGTGESGVASTWYKVDAGAWTSFTTAFQINTTTSASHLIQYYSKDNCGNVGNVQNYTYHPPAGVTITVNLAFHSSVDGAAISIAYLHVYVSAILLSAPSFTLVSQLYSLVVTRFDDNATLFSAIEDYLVTGNNVNIALPAVNILDVRYKDAGGVFIDPAEAALFVDNHAVLTGNSICTQAYFVSSPCNITVRDTQNYSIWTYFGPLLGDILYIPLPFAFVGVTNNFNYTCLVKLVHNGILITKRVDGNGQTAYYYLSTGNYSYTVCQLNGTQVLNFTAVAFTNDSATWGIDFGWATFQWTPQDRANSFTYELIFGTLGAGTVIIVIALAAVSHRQQRRRQGNSENTSTRGARVPGLSI